MLEVNAWQRSRAEIVIAAGGMLWVIAGVLLSLRSSGHPPHSFRHSNDLMPIAGTGILLIGLGISSILSDPGKRKASLQWFASALILCSAFSYALGCFLRTGFINGRWEPFMPLGFLGSIVGLLLAGVASRKSKELPSVVCYLFIVAALCLLCFNDQYLPAMAVPFGVIMIVLAILLARNRAALVNGLH